MMASERRKFSLRIRPVNDFLSLVQVRTWTLDAQMKWFSTRSGNRLESVPISGADYTLFKPFFCPTFGETLMKSIQMFEVTRDTYALKFSISVEFDDA